MSAAESTISGWHDFYFMTGSMAATLLGLYFVALTLRGDIRREQPGSFVRSATSASFSSLITVILYAMYFMIPDESAENLGISIGLTSLITGYILFRRLWLGRHLGRRIDSHTVKMHLLPLACHVVALAVAGTLLAGSTDWLPMLVPVVALLLIVPTRNAWNLVFTDQVDA